MGQEPQPAQFRDGAEIRAVEGGAGGVAEEGRHNQGRYEGERCRLKPPRCLSSHSTLRKPVTMSIFSSLSGPIPRQVTVPGSTVVWPASVINAATSFSLSAAALNPRRSSRLPTFRTTFFPTLYPPFSTNSILTWEEGCAE